MQEYKKSEENEKQLRKTEMQEYRNRRVHIGARDAGVELLRT